VKIGRDEQGAYRTSQRTERKEWGLKGKQEPDENVLELNSYEEEPHGKRQISPYRNRQTAEKDTIAERGEETKRKRGEIRR